MILCGKSGMVEQNELEAIMWTITDFRIVNQDTFNYTGI